MSYNPFANIFYMKKTYFPWKGRTFNQITSAIQLNINSALNLSPNQLRKPQPLRIYRREIAVYGSNAPNNKFLSNRRISNKIENLDMPGSTIVSANKNNPIGVCNSIDINYPNNTTELPGKCKVNCTNQICITDPACNARKRVRSAGMIKRVDPKQNNKSYCTNTNQYLVSRNIAFSSNEYAYLRSGNPSIKPGPVAALSNQYSTGGLSYCNVININSSNNTFSYYWIDNQMYTVTITPGSYNLDSFISAFNAQLFSNNTYLVYISTGQKISLLSIAYDNITNQVLLQSSGIYQYYYNGTQDKYYLGSSERYTLANSNISLYMPYFVIPATNIQTLIGFTSGNYNNFHKSGTNYNVLPPGRPLPTPGTGDNAAALPINTQSVSNMQHLLYPTYVKMNYKPSNSKFAQQGAVSSSAAILRKKYDTITTTADITRGTFGSSVANAMSYGVSEDPNTIKKQIGFPDTKYPFFKKNGTTTCVSEKSNCNATMRLNL